MNNRTYVFIGIFVSVFFIYKFAIYEGEVEQQAVTVEHVKEGVKLAKVAITHVENYFEDYRSTPPSNKEVGLPHPSEMTSKNVERVIVRGNEIIVVFKKHLQNGVKFRVRSEFTRSDPVTLEWRCNTGNLDKQFFEEAFPECMYTDSDIKADLLKGIRTSDLELMQEALDDGADVNQVVAYQTPLFFAIEKRKVELIEFLLDNGADIELPSNKVNGKTPLMHALTNGSIEVVKYLVDRGADVSAQDKKGKSVLKFVRFNDNTMKEFLIEAGAVIEDY